MRGVIAAIEMAPVRARQTASSTASMPNARSRWQGQAPQPPSGAPKAQGLTLARRTAAQSSEPSNATRHKVKPNPPRPTGSEPPAATLQIPTRLTDVTMPGEAWDAGSHSMNQKR